LTVHDIHEQELHPLLHTTLWESFHVSARLEPDAVAVIDGDREVSRGELAGLAERASARLRAAGVSRMDRVVVKGDNTVDTIVACLAVSRIGAVLVPVPRKHGRRETTFICETVDPAAVLCREIDDTVGAVNGAALLTFADLADGCAPVLALPLAVDDVAVVGFTAGTTGSPKGVMVTSAALNYSTARWAQVIGLRPGDRVLALLPVSYLSGYAYAVHIALTRGMTVVCLRDWDPVAALDTLARHRCTWSTSITTHVIMMVTAAEAGWRGDLSAMRGLTCGGAPIADELADRVQAALGIPLLRAYGLTECLGTTIMRPEDTAEDRRRFDGFPITGTDIEAFDDKGNMLPRGTVGVGGMRGPAMFTGYYGDPEQTAANFGAAGFLMTGDLIVRDRRGFVKVVGRVRDFIIRGGMNIDPVEIEDLIRSHPSVRDVAVVGYPDERLGERACACVVLNEGAEFSMATMVEFLLTSGLTKQKLPERYVEVAEIPLSDVGKPLKAELRKLIAPAGT
jgi:acyl-CoA synthetase (AMP-forming)/AMP-acid ligase II